MINKNSAFTEGQYRKGFNDNTVIWSVVDNTSIYYRYIINMDEEIKEDS